MTRPTKPLLLGVTVLIIGIVAYVLITAEAGRSLNVTDRPNKKEVGGAPLFQMTAGWGPCPPGAVCEEKIQLYSGGKIIFDDRGDVYTQYLTTSEVDEIAGEIQRTEIVRKRCGMGKAVVDYEATYTFNLGDETREIQYPACKDETGKISSIIDSKKISENRFDQSSIQNLNEKNSPAGDYRISGYVVMRSICMPCPEGAVCETCLRNHIIISVYPRDNWTRPGPGMLSNTDLVIVTEDAASFEEGKAYEFFITTQAGYGFTGNYIDGYSSGVHLVGYKNVAENTDASADSETADWDVYRNEEFAYEFKYPPGANVSEHAQYFVVLTDKDGNSVMNVSVEKNVEHRSYAPFGVWERKIRVGDMLADKYVAVACGEDVDTEYCHKAIFIVLENGSLRYIFDIKQQGEFIDKVLDTFVIR